MRSYDKEPNNENIIKSLRENWLKRNSEIKDFIQILDQFEDINSIALDGIWGSGKTFFVKQVQTILNSKNECTVLFEEKDTVIEIINNDNSLFQLNLSQNYMAVYYDAWLYDDHKDPVLSLLYVIVKGMDFKINTKINSSLEDKILSVADCLNFWSGGSLRESKDILIGRNILDEISTLEEVKEKINNIIDELLEQRASKLVIFLDELDRCNPQYTILVLERLKHFYDNKKVIFVYSVNKEQLVYTIKKVYGNEFDGAGYLNKFFKINLGLSQITHKEYAEYLDLDSDEGWLNVGIFNICSYYNFSLRDCNIYFNSIGRIKHVWLQEADQLLELIVMILLAVKINNHIDFRKIISGKGFELLKDIIEESPDIKYSFNYIIKAKEDIDQQDHTVIDYSLYYFKIYNYLFRDIESRPKSAKYNTKVNLHKLLNS